MTPLIEVVDLVKTYTDGTQALRGASFVIQEGEFVAIMGPSGSGKSTLLHILGFLDPQTSGIYKFTGKLFQDFTPSELARVRNEELGFVFQQFNLMPRQTVLENIYMPLYYSSVPKKEWRTRAEKVVAQVGLSHRIDHEAYTLSGGEKQRVAIARALINKPKLIFADEPTGNLDTKSGTDVMELLKALHTLGHTIILITHDQKIANHARRMLFIQDGRLQSDTEI
ncbi:TPA: macrolide ABC transporter ATP-binding protein [Patescibacteria group bacterium]|nr:MAG: ABC-type antimicrobial peptide transport system, ATPase component [Parcubacteria group bacterium GW2011_GWD2_42_14]HCC05362.1 macrolide ABC transporter ATP-binding protein [Patescibacteria group bacterium]